MTVANLRRNVTIEEEEGWLAYHSMIAEERKKAMDEAKRQQGSGRRPSKRARGR